MAPKNFMFNLDNNKVDHGSRTFKWNKGQIEWLFHLRRISYVTSLFKTSKNIDLIPFWWCYDYFLDHQILKSGKWGVDDWVWDSFSFLLPRLCLVEVSFGGWMLQVFSQYSFAFYYTSGTCFDPFLFPNNMMLIIPFGKLWWHYCISDVKLWCLSRLYIQHIGGLCGSLYKASPWLYLEEMNTIFHSQIDFFYLHKSEQNHI